jgi:TolB-like protein
LIPAAGGRARRIPILAFLAAALLAGSGAGCGKSGPPKTRAWALPTNHPRAALLPLENLTTTPNTSEVVTRVFFAELASTGTVSLVEPGNVDVALDALRIRATGTPTTDQYAMLGDTLHVEYIFTGSLLEAGTVRTSEGEVPSVGAAMRMVEARTGRVVWAGVKFRTGDDRETVFGMGRVRNAQQLAGELAQDLFQDFVKLGEEQAKQAKAEGAKK